MKTKIKKNILLFISPKTKANKTIHRKPSKDRIHIHCRKHTIERRIRKNTLPSRPNNPTMRITTRKTMAKTNRNSRSNKYSLEKFVQKIKL